MTTKQLLLPFYFGSLSEDDRLRVERDLLFDSEMLTEYLDLKRGLEAAPLPSLEPSPWVWTRLQVRTRKRVMWSIGAALAAGLALFLFLRSPVESAPFVQPSASGVLFDSSAELPASSGVL